MNIYDTKVIGCTNCKKSIGEVEFDSFVIRPLCGTCANSLAQKTLDPEKHNPKQPLIKISQAS